MQIYIKYNKKSLTDMQGTNIIRCLSVNNATNSKKDNPNKQKSPEK